MSSLILVLAAALLALGYAAGNFASVRKMEEGNERMSYISGAIRKGANVFIQYEYKIIAIVVAIVFVIFALIFSLQEGTLRWEHVRSAES